MTALAGRQPVSVLATLLVTLTLVACGVPADAGDGAVPTGVVASPSSRPMGATAPTATKGPTSTATSTTGPVGAMTDPAAAVSTLAVTPAAGQGGTTFAIAGAGFAPNATLHVVGRDPDQEFVVNRPITADAAGALSLSFNSLGRAPGVYTVTVGADFMAAVGGMGGLVLARGAFTVTEGGPAPTLTLEPERGPCAEREPAIIARGRNFPPNTSIFLYVGSAAGLASGGRRVTGDDGTFAFPVRLSGCGPATPDGTPFRIIVPWLQHNVNPNRVLTSATFTVAASAPSLPYVPTPSPDPR